jgi:8-oxo-dGTP pyrophosphatase MutT (NUDIX family)
LVKSNDNKVLVIFRRGKWDLPKGKLEKGETIEFGAMREVEEECGITDLEIQKLIEITYHTYKIGDQDILKKTYWFEMIHKRSLKPKPQTEEEITEARWIDVNEITEISNNTFPSIIEVFKKGEIL